jgi:hypothetical protein
VRWVRIALAVTSYLVFMAVAFMSMNGVPW